MTDTEWMAQASCRDVEPDTFFPTGVGVAGRREAREAVLICRECPVIAECRVYAKRFAHGHGVWAGSYRGVDSFRNPGRPKKATA